MFYLYTYTYMQTFKEKRESCQLFAQSGRFLYL